MNQIEAIISDHNKEMRKDIAAEITGGTRSASITNVVTAKAIQAHINAEIAKVLDRIEQEVKITIYDGDDSFGKEYQVGYNAMAEATRVYQLGMMSAIQAERAKLKERDDE